MTEAALQQANEAYSKMVSNQLSRATGELNRLDVLLKAGHVDGRVLTEFRDAVNRVRTSGWQVQVWLEGDARALSVLLVEERIRIATRLCQQLATEVANTGEGVLGEGVLGLGSLRDAISELKDAMGEKG